LDLGSETQAQIMRSLTRTLMTRSRTWSWTWLHCRESWLYLYVSLLCIVNIAFELDLHLNKRIGLLHVL